MKSGKFINNEILKVLPIRNGDGCILRHFENFDSIYVSNQVHLKENEQILSKVINSIGKNLN